ncbi:MAG: rod shape-determining protein RodA, partial [Nonlabens sp.]|nr:rod shape-determining protein RodA [Nonlabens sp.]
MKPTFDISIILIYIALITIGWLSIYSASSVEDYGYVFNLSTEYGTQLLWIAMAVFLITILLAVDVRFYEGFAYPVYIVSLISLAGLYVFGKEVSGATSWYGIGSASIQPSEFAKFATALAVSKFLSNMDVSLFNTKDLLIVGGIIALPAILIVPQPDPGSALVYVAFFFALHRMGLSPWYLLLGLVAIALFLGTLLIGPLYVSMITVVIMIIVFLLSRKRRHKKRLAKPRISLYTIVACVGIAYAFSTSYVFDNVFQDRHRNRINIVLGKVEDNQGIGYNSNQSKIAIGSGGLLGKGFFEGTQTHGGFVPEQSTDYIFTAIGEEFGFVGAGTVVILFMLLIYRLVIMAERQRSKFALIYGYCVAGIFFIHFFVNIGMVLGLLPTVGIPLPFMSYGGSGLWGFTILLFIFIKLDGH